MNDGPSRAETTAQLKAEIDSGGTGDKVRTLDPAASPLGTDDEAAGAPPSKARVAMAHDAETSRQLETPEDNKPFNAMWIVVIVAAFAVFFAGFAWLVR